MAGRVERRLRPAATPGYWRQHVHKESARNTGSPKAWSAMTNRKPVRDRLGALGWRRGCDVRFTPDSDRTADIDGGPVRATRRLMHRTKQHLYSITSSARSRSAGG